MAKKTKIFGFLLLGILVGFTVRFVALGQQSQGMPVSSSYKEGKLTPCQAHSNCYETEVADDQTKTLLKAAGEKEFTLIQDYLKTNNFKEVMSTKDYFHFTEQSALFGFVDDVEFALTNEGIVFRSASRVGKSDLGANKKRINRILNNALKTQTQ